MAITAATPEYDKKEYWVNRFEHESSFEWLVDAKTLLPILEEHVPHDSKIVQLGCGNSSLAFDAFDAGYTDILSLDYCENVIQRMVDETRRRYPVGDSGVPAGPRWRVMDILAMQDHLAPGSIDCAVDKCTMDAIACGDDAQATRINALERQVHRILKPGSHWFVLSYSSTRFDEFAPEAKDRWDKIIVPIEVSPSDAVSTSAGPVYQPAIYYYCYILRKL
ncbi:hypothetical protein EV182_000398 [Spiromyces aspiralis]|uniref:Uncharacterized protein n=1 Tax=Spiromyces aspiralis TaxID=68401 RepID=A0ACC1HUY2_9FUNG|nr:hypothetical protein EV182_000398 [Spiromyces aspiralis]